MPHCPVCNKNTMSDLRHRCTERRLSALEREYAREEEADESYDSRILDDPLSEGFFLLGMKEGEHQ